MARDLRYIAAQELTRHDVLKKNDSLALVQQKEGYGFYRI